MAFRTVVVSNEAELHVQRGQLVAVQEQTVWIPTEDIAVLVLENPRVHISAAALSLLAEQGVAVAVCDRKHMPTGILLPHCTHSRQLGVTRLQFAQSLPQKKRLWQRIVRSKIENQAECLEALDRGGAPQLRSYAGAVLSGDSSGMESAAARMYFKHLIPDATRRSPDGPGRSLDYGYAIVRAAIARALVGHGLFPAVGLHHDSQLNAFNLADDILEPFRPFVDFIAMRRSADAATAEGRRALISVLQAPCALLDRSHTLLTAIDATATGLVRAMAEKDPTLMPVPVFDPSGDMAEALME